MNPLALRLDCSDDPTFRELLARVRDVVLDALANDDVPFELVADAVEPQRDRRQSPLFQVMFSLEPPLPPLPAAWNLTQLDVETGAAKFELYLELDERPDGAIGRFMYWTDLFERATIRRMVGHFQSSGGRHRRRSRPAPVGAAAHGRRPSGASCSSGAQCGRLIPTGRQFTRRSRPWRVELRMRWR